MGSNETTTMNRQGENNPFYGHKHTEETKALMSEREKGKVRSQETRDKMSAAQKGKPKSEEQRRNMSLAQQGRVTSEETKQKLREHNLQEEVLKKNRESKMQVWIVTTPEGIEEEVEDLTLYCKEKGLTRSKMYEVASGARKQHKGYKCRKKNS